MKGIDRYIIRLIMTPLFMTLGVAALLLLLERMLRLFDFVVNQGGPVEVVFRMLGSLVPHYLGLALPLGLFLGILLTFRKISMNSELDAMGSCGIGLTRLLRPVMATSLFFMAINVALVGFVQPHSRYTYQELVFDLRSGALGASIKVGEFVNLGKNTVLRIEESRNNGSELLGIFLERTSPGGRNITVTADRGGFFSTRDQQNVILRLYNGTLVDLNEGNGRPRVLTFDVQDITIPLPSHEEFRERGLLHLELTVLELWDRMDDPGLNQTTRNAFRGNFHWRVAHTMIFLLIPFLAMSLGITNKRSGRSLGLVIGLTIVITYNELSEVGQALIASGQTTPLKSLYALFGLTALLALRLFYVRAATVGGEPLVWLDKLWQFISDPFIKLFHRMTKAKA